MTTAKRASCNSFQTSRLSTIRKLSINELREDLRMMSSNEDFWLTSVRVGGRKVVPSILFMGKTEAHWVSGVNGLRTLTDRR